MQPLLNLSLNKLYPSYPNPPNSSTHKPPTPPTLPTSLPLPTTDHGLQFRHKLLYLESLNINSHKALHLNPNLLSTPLHSLLSVEQCLLSMSLPRHSLGRILDMFPLILTLDPHRHLYPVFEFLLNEVRIPYPDVSKSIVRCPRLLVSSVGDQLRPNLLFLRKLGFVGSRGIDCNTTVLLVSSVEKTLMPKIRFLEGVGFSQSDVGNMVVRSPALLTYSVEKNLGPKFEYFVKEMKGEVREIKRFPQFFSFSLEGRIKPRHGQLMEHGVEMRLCDMLKVSDGEFNVRLLEMKLRRCDRG